MAIFHAIFGCRIEMVAPNRHVTNRRIFEKLDAAAPLFQLYCKLIALELSLKDFDSNNFPRSHDICDMAVRSFAASSAIAAAAQTLNGDLATLACSDLHGSASTVRSHKYPDLRYARMLSDFDPPASTDAQVGRVLKSLDALIQELRKEGLPWP